MLLKVDIQTGEVLVNRVFEYSKEERVLIGDAAEAYSRKFAEKFWDEWDRAHEVASDHEKREQVRKIEAAKCALAPEIAKLRAMVEKPHPNPVTQKRIVGRMRGVLKKKLAARCGGFVLEMPDDQLMHMLLD